MGSIVPDFEYDIFISYRHNDNLSGWVTAFVHGLEKELLATLKDPLTVYFDKNPHDGLLETHNVDKSLEGKLKCLIFIPIISQTYCDSKSFAWQHEFCAFNKAARESTLGREIKLNNGNVASRILPVMIHDLDRDDKAAIDEQIGSPLRAIEFIFKAPGVNRPLEPSDSPENNRNKTLYKDQVNKTANAIKGLITALKNPGAGQESYTATDESEEIRIPDHKSIAVLPFVNMSSDVDQEYFSDGLTEEIIADLSKVNQLRVISRSSIMTLKGSQKKINTIASEMNVRYVLEGSVRKSGGNLRITAQLIDAKNDGHLWAEKYSGTMEDVFDIQEKVSRSIVDALKLKLSPEEDTQIAERPIKDVHAYECYLKARQALYRGSKQSMEQAFELIQNALDLVGPNELLYASLGYASYFYFRFVDKLDKSYLTTAADCAKKIFELNPASSHGHVITGWIHTTNSNLQESVRSMKRALKIAPNNYDALSGLAANYIWAGQSESARPIAKELVEIDPLTSFNYIVRGGVDMLGGEMSGIAFFEKAYAMDSQSPFNIWQLASGYLWCERNDKAMPLIDQLEKAAPEWPITKQVLFLKFGLLGDKQRALAYATKELDTEAGDDHHFAFHVSECYAVIGEKEKALDLLEHSIKAFFPYSFLMVNPLFKNLHAEQRFQRLLMAAKRKTEAFEV